MTSSGEPVTSTGRLTLTPMGEDDARFLLEVMADADFIRFIGDRGLRTEDDARAFIRDRFLPHQARHGFSIYRVALHDGTPVGMCGLVSREELPCPDLGFACHPRHRRQGYMREASLAVIELARDGLGLEKLCAAVQPEHRASIGLLESLGMSRTGTTRLGGETVDLLLYELTL